MSSNTIRLDTGFPADPAGTGSRDAAGWLGWARNGYLALRRHRQRRQAIVELSRMPDWRLADMGIPRGQIAEIVDGLIAREGPSAAGRAI